MTRLCAVVMAILMAVALPAFSVFAEESPTFTMELTGDGEGSTFDVYPGTFGVADTVAPVYVVADKAGNVEMFCVMNDGGEAGIRKEGSRPSGARPATEIGLRSSTLIAWRSQHRQSD